MFEDSLNEDVGNEGWFLLAFSFLWQAFEFMFDGTRNPATESQQVTGKSTAKNSLNAGISIDHTACLQVRSTS